MEVPGGDFDAPLNPKKRHLVVSWPPESDFSKTALQQALQPGGGDIDGDNSAIAQIFKLASEVSSSPAQEEASPVLPTQKSVAPPGPTETFETVIPLPPSDYDLTDLDGWRVAGSLGMMESEKLAGAIKRKIVNLTTRWASVMEASPSAMSPDIREHNLRVLTDSMVALLHDASKVLYNFTKRGIITEWLEATLAVSKARSILRKSRDL